MSLLSFQQLFSYIVNISLLWEENADRCIVLTGENLCWTARLKCTSVMLGLWWSEVSDLNHIATEDPNHKIMSMLGQLLQELYCEKK